LRLTTRCESILDRDTLLGRDAERWDAERESRFASEFTYFIAGYSVRLDILDLGKNSPAKFADLDLQKGHEISKQHFHKSAGAFVSGEFQNRSQFFRHGPPHHELLEYLPVDQYCSEEDVDELGEGTTKRTPMNGKHDN
jgi:hypothetical protein